MKYNVALIYGGEGFEHDISVKSAKNLAALIDKSKYSVVFVFISKTGEWFIEDTDRKIPTFPAYFSGKGGLFAAGALIPIDVAIPVLHGNVGEDGVITGALRASHIKFVGCDVLAGAVCADKIITKMLADALKIPTAEWIFTVGEDREEAKEKAEEQLDYPLFIKPAALGSSIGISKVTASEDFIPAYEKAKALCERILIEKAIEVECELECAYLSLDGEDRYAVGKILCGGKFYGFDEKYNKFTDTKTSLPTSSVTDRVIGMARTLKGATSIGGLARFDFFLSKNGRILFNEINTFPGMTGSSLYPALTLDMGLKEGEFINRLLSEALL